MMKTVAAWIVLGFGWAAVGVLMLAYLVLLPIGGRKVLVAVTRIVSNYSAKPSRIVITRLER